MDEILELIQKLENGNFSEQEDARDRLSEIGKPAVHVLIKLMESPRIDIQTSARDALAKIGEPVIEDLAETLNSTEKYFLQLRILTVLEKIGKPALPLFIEAIKTDRWRNRVILALGKIGDKSAISALVDAWDKADGKGKERLVTAFGRIRDLRGVNPLIQALTSNHKRMHWEAEQNLQKILDGCDSIIEVDQYMGELEDAMNELSKKEKASHTIKGKNKIAILLSDAMKKRNELFANGGLIISGVPKPPKKGMSGIYHSTRRIRDG
jgi:HEAT repeat protein